MKNHISLSTILFFKAERLSESPRSFCILFDALSGRDTPDPNEFTDFEHKVVETPISYQSASDQLTANCPCTRITLRAIGSTSYIWIRDLLIHLDNDY